MDWGGKQHKLSSAVSRAALSLNIFWSNLGWSFGQAYRLAAHLLERRRMLGEILFGRGHEGGAAKGYGSGVLSD